MVSARLKETIKESISPRDFVNNYTDNKIIINKTECVFCGSKNTPALHIYPTLFKCYSCGKSFDVIDYVRGFYKISFKEAIDCLCNLLGIDSKKPKYKYVPKKYKLKVGTGMKYDMETDSIIMDAPIYEYFYTYKAMMKKKGELHIEYWKSELIRIRVAFMEMIGKDEIKEDSPLCNYVFNELGNSFFPTELMEMYFPTVRDANGKIISSWAMIKSEENIA